MTSLRLILIRPWSAPAAGSYLPRCDGVSLLRCHVEILERLGVLEFLVVVAHLERVTRTEADVRKASYDLASESGGRDTALPRPSPSRGVHPPSPRRTRCGSRVRLFYRYHLEPLSPSDTGDYIRKRMTTAGCDREVFAHDALAMLHEAATGALRDVDRIATAALRAATKRGRKLVERDVIIDVVSTRTTEDAP